MAAVLGFYSVFMPKINLLKMRLCDAFVAKTRGGRKLPKRVCLRNGGGVEFEVEVVKEGGEVYFGEGWRKFVEENQLRSGYVMIFRYDGVRTFVIKIYDYSSCEVEFDDPDSDDDDEVFSDKNDSFGDTLDEEDEQDEESEDEEEYEESEDGSDSVSGSPGHRAPNRSNKGSGKRGQAQQKRPYYRHTWEDSEAELLVKPGSLYFVTEKGARKRKNQVQVTGMAIRDFHVELGDKVVYRDPRGREYVGKVSRWKSGQIWISAWGTFCKRNRLSDSDKCVFELEIGEGRKCSSMLVHIIRKQ